MADSVGMAGHSVEVSFPPRRVSLSLIRERRLSLKETLQLTGKQKQLVSFHVSSVGIHTVSIFKIM